ncbi:hypothetical protein [Sedimentitalea sp.]|uniref:hypothetical protein n=1 Tax=Sedimentitalea sp. TaxID=2048915 RepID=UPI0032974883
MQKLMKRCAMIFVLATAVAAAVPMTAMAERGVAKQVTYGKGSKVKVVKQKSHRHAVGHRFRKQDVIVVKDWRTRGLPNPGRNEIYVVNGDSIYLTAAATLLVKALID